MNQTGKTISVGIKHSSASAEDGGVFGRLRTNKNIFFGGINMKKSFKRAGVAVLSMAMLLSMGAVGAMTANAANVTVTVAANNVADGTVTAYKVASKAAGTWSWETTALSDAAKTVNSEYDDFSKFAGETENSVNLQKLAVALAGATTGATSVAGKIGDGMTITDAGYYLFVTTPADNSTLVQPILKEIKGTEGTLALDAKGSKVSLTKTITEVKDGTANSGHIDDGGKNANASSGDTITYKIVSAIPSYNPGVDNTSLVDYVLTDTYSDTLNYVSATAIVGDQHDATTGTDTTVVSDATNHKFTVTLSGDTLKAAGGKFLIVTFKATLGNSPVISKNLGVRTTFDDTDKKADSNPNDVKLTYGNDYNTGRYYDKTGDGETDDDKPELDDYADVYTTGIEVTKTMGSAGSTPTDGEVEFELYKDSVSGTLVRAAQGVVSGKVNFVGLESGTYIIHESKKSDYYKGAADVKVVIKEDGSVAKFTKDTGTSTGVNVDNKGKGFTVKINNPDLETLPGTGGMGTVLFTVGGAAIVLLAGALFVVYLRKRKTEE